ncbi:MAG: hypothetical protein HYW37_02405 [Candidatus Colwellbacteria bacterium]|nr:hypothetical protein [Candidatus Colwellbacteria bacterium]
MALSTWKKKLSEPAVKIGILIFLVTSLAFGLGYLSAKNWNPAPIVIEKNSSN